MDLGKFQGNPLNRLYQYAGQVGSRVYFQDPPPEPPPGPPPTPPAFAADGWKGKLPEEIRNHPSLASFSDNGDGLLSVVKSHVNVQPLVGLDKIPIPGKDSPPEVRDEAFKRLGWPEKVEDYKYERPQAPDNFKVDENFEKGFLAKAHEQRLLPSQVQELANFYYDYGIKQFQAVDAMMEEEMAGGETTLRKQWGNAFNQNMTMAQRVMDTFAGEKFKKFLDDTGLGNRPQMSEFLYEIGKAMSEGKLIGKPRVTFKSPAEAEAEIKRLQADKEFMRIYQDSNDPGHQEAVDRMAALHEAAYPEEAT